MLNAESAEHDNQRLSLARELVVALEKGDEHTADSVMAELAVLQETCMFQEIGRLTRQLHDTMRNFSLDVRITDLAETDIPDARERLHYVIAMTEQAANTTLNQVEELTPISLRLTEESAGLRQKWDRLLNRKLPYEEFRALSQELKSYLEFVNTESTALHDGLNEILMAQGFQDVTGQIIRKVIDLVQDIERSMVELIKISGGAKKAGKAETKDSSVLEGPIVPGVNDNDSVGTQDDVDDLLSSLGF